MLAFVTCFALVSLLLWANRTGPARTRLITYAGANGEFQDVTKGLRLPPGVAWPQKVRQPQGVVAGQVRYQAGYGTQQAQFYWYCAWSRAWLAAQPGSPAAKNDLAALKRIYGMQLYTRFFDPPSQQYTHREITAAQHGDGGPLQVDVSENCPRDVTG